MNNSCVETKQLQLASLYLKDFRCFDQITFDLDSRIVLIYGPNGTGKTSLLEALYYGCYLRSFRTHLSRDLVALGKSSFFVKFMVKNGSEDSSLNHTIQIGFTNLNNKRLVKVDNTTTISYKDLLSYYRVVSLTEDDLKLVQDGPLERRAFMDQALLLHDASLLSKMREYRVIVEQRNALFQQQDNFDKEAYFIWTQKLWDYSSYIQKARKTLLLALEKEINSMLYRYVDENLSVSFVYQEKMYNDISFDIFWHKNNENLLPREIYLKRTLFGAHIDDFNIILEGKKSRAYASRGQQKMIVLLVKIAQIKQLAKKSGSIIFLLDDFMTDFDIERGKALLSALFELNCQLIFTAPRRDSALESALRASNTDYKIISM